MGREKSKIIRLISSGKKCWGGGYRTTISNVKKTDVHITYLHWHESTARCGTVAHEERWHVWYDLWAQQKYYYYPWLSNTHLTPEDQSYIFHFPDGIHQDIKCMNTNSRVVVSEGKRWEWVPTQQARNRATSREYFFPDSHCLEACSAPKECLNREPLPWAWRARGKMDKLQTTMAWLSNSLHFSN